MDGKDENAHHPNTSEACCREHFDTLNVIITSIKDQFNRKAYFAFLKLEQFLLNIISESNYDSELEFFQHIYKDDENSSN